MATSSNPIKRPTESDPNVGRHGYYLLQDTEVKRRHLPPQRIYHFNVVYNWSDEEENQTADTRLALRVTRSLVSRLEIKGYVNSYYHDRDCCTQDLLRELERVTEGSSVTILLLTPGFLHKCLHVYLKDGPICYLATQPSQRRRLLCLSVGVAKCQLPPGLEENDVLYFGQDWELDIPVWECVDKTLQRLIGLTIGPLVIGQECSSQIFTNSYNKAITDSQHRLNMRSSTNDPHLKQNSPQTLTRQCLGDAVNNHFNMEEELTEEINYWNAELDDEVLYKTTCHDPKVYRNSELGLHRKYLDDTSVKRDYRDTLSVEYCQTSNTWNDHKESLLCHESRASGSQFYVEKTYNVFDTPDRKSDSDVEKLCSTYLPDTTINGPDKAEKGCGWDFERWTNAEKWSKWTSDQEFGDHSDKIKAANQSELIKLSLGCVSPSSNLTLKDFGISVGDDQALTKVEHKPRQASDNKQGQTPKGTANLESRSYKDTKDDSYCSRFHEPDDFSLENAWEPLEITSLKINGQTSGNSINSDLKVGDQLMRRLYEHEPIQTDNFEVYSDDLWLLTLGASQMFLSSEISHPITIEREHDLSSTTGKNSLGSSEVVSQGPLGKNSVAMLEKPLSSPSKLVDERRTSCGRLNVWEAHGDKRLNSSNKSYAHSISPSLKRKEAPSLSALYDPPSGFTNTYDGMSFSMKDPGYDPYGDFKGNPHELYSVGKDSGFEMYDDDSRDCYFESRRNKRELNEESSGSSLDLNNSGDSHFELYDRSSDTLLQLNNAGDSHFEYDRSSDHLLQLNYAGDSHFEYDRSSDNLLQLNYAGDSHFELYDRSSDNLLQLKNAGDSHFELHDKSRVGHIALNNEPRDFEMYDESRFSHTSSELNNDYRDSLYELYDSRGSLYETNDDYRRVYETPTHRGQNDPCFPQSMTDKHFSGYMTKQSDSMLNQEQKDPPSILSPTVNLSDHWTVGTNHCDDATESTKYTRGVLIKLEATEDRNSENTGGAVNPLIEKGMKSFEQSSGVDQLNREPDTFMACDAKAAANVTTSKSDTGNTGSRNIGFNVSSNCELSVRTSAETYVPTSIPLSKVANNAEPSEKLTGDINGLKSNVKCIEDSEALGSLGRVSSVEYNHKPAHHNSQVVTEQVKLTHEPRVANACSHGELYDDDYSDNFSSKKSTSPNTTTTETKDESGSHGIDSDHQNGHNTLNLSLANFVENMSIYPRTKAENILALRIAGLLESETREILSSGKIPLSQDALELTQNDLSPTVPYRSSQHQSTFLPVPKLQTELSLRKQIEASSSQASNPESVSLPEAGDVDDSKYKNNPTLNSPEEKQLKDASGRESTAVSVPAIELGGVSSPETETKSILTPETDTMKYLTCNTKQEPTDLSRQESEGSSHKEPEDLSRQESEGISHKEPADILYLEIEHGAVSQEQEPESISQKETESTLQQEPEGISYPDTETSPENISQSETDPKDISQKQEPEYVSQQQPEDVSFQKTKHEDISQQQQQPGSISQKQSDVVSNSKPGHEDISQSETKPENISQLETEPEDISEQDPEGISCQETASAGISRSEKEPEDISHQGPRGISFSETETEDICQSNTAAENISQTETEQEGNLFTKTKPGDISQKEVGYISQQQEPECISKQEPEGISSSGTETAPADISLSEIEPDNIFQSETELEEITQHKTESEDKSQEPGGIVYPETEPEDMSPQQEPEGISQQEPGGISQQQTENISKQEPEGISQQQHKDISQQQPKCFSQQEPEGLSQQQPEGISQQKPEGISQQEHEGISQQQPEGISQQEPEGISQQQEHKGIFQQQEHEGISQQQEPEGISQQQEHEGISQQQEHEGISQLKPEGISQQEPEGINQQQEHEGISEQQEPEGISQQQEPEGISQQQEYEGISQQQEPEGISQQQPESISQQEPEGISQQQEHEGISQQQEHDGISQKQPEDFSQKEPECISQQQEPEGISQQQEPEGISQQQEHEGISQQQEHEGISQQQEPPEGISQQQPIGISQQKPEGISQQQEHEGISQQEPEGISQQQEPEGISQQQPEGFSQQEPEGISQQQEHEGISEQQEHEGISQQQEHEGISQQQEYKGISQQQREGISQQEPDGISQQQEHKGISQQQEHEAISQQQEHEGISQQQQEDFSQQEPECISQQQEPEGISQQQEHEGISQQQDPEGISQQEPEGISQQEPEGISQQEPECLSQKQPEGISQQEPEGISQQQEPEGISQQQEHEGISQQHPKGISEQEPGGISQQQEHKGIFQHQEHEGISQQQEPEGISQQQEHEGISQQQEHEGISQQKPEGISQQEPEGISQQQEHEGISQQEPEGISQQEPEGISQQEPEGISQQQEPEGIFQHQEHEGISQQQEPEGISQQQEHEGISQQKPEGISQQEPEGISQQQENEGISEQQEPEGISQQEPEGISQQQEPECIFQHQEHEGISQQQEPEGISQQQEHEGISQQKPEGISQQEPEGISQQQEHEGISEQQEPEGISQQQEPEGISQQQEPEGISQQDPDSISYPKTASKDIYQSEAEPENNSQKETEGITQQEQKGLSIQEPEGISYSETETEDLSQIKTEYILKRHETDDISQQQEHISPHEHEDISQQERELERNLHEEPETEKTYSEFILKQETGPKSVSNPEIEYENILQPETTLDGKVQPEKEHDIILQKQTEFGGNLHPDKENDTILQETEPEGIVPEKIQIEYISELEPETKVQDGTEIEGNSHHGTEAGDSSQKTQSERLETPEFAREVLLHTEILQQEIISADVSPPETSQHEACLKQETDTVDTSALKTELSVCQPIKEHYGALQPEEKEPGGPSQPESENTDLKLETKRRFAQTVTKLEGVSPQKTEQAISPSETENDSVSLNVSDNLNFSPLDTEQGGSFFVTEDRGVLKARTEQCFPHPETGVQGISPTKTEGLTSLVTDLKHNRLTKNVIDDCVEPASVNDDSFVLEDRTSFDVTSRSRDIVQNNESDVRSNCTNNPEHNIPSTLELIDAAEHDVADSTFGALAANLSARHDITEGETNDTPSAKHHATGFIPHDSVVIQTQDCTDGLFLEDQDVSGDPPGDKTDVLLPGLTDGMSCDGTGEISWDDKRGMSCDITGDMSRDNTCAIMGSGSNEITDGKHHLIDVGKSRSAREVSCISDVMVITNDTLDGCCQIKEVHVKAATTHITIGDTFPIEDSIRSNTDDTNLKLVGETFHNTCSTCDVTCDHARTASSSSSENRNSVECNSTMTRKPSWIDKVITASSEDGVKILVARKEDGAEMAIRICSSLKEETTKYLFHDELLAEIDSSHPKLINNSLIHGETINSRVQVAPQELLTQRKESLLYHLCDEVDSGYFGQSFNKSDLSMDQMNELDRQNANNGGIISHDELKSNDLGNDINADDSKPTNMGNGVNSDDSKPTNMGNSVNIDDSKPTNMGNSVNSDDSKPIDLANSINFDDLKPTDLRNSVKADDSKPTNMGNSVNIDDSKPIDLANSINFDDLKPTDLRNSVKADDSKPTDLWNTGKDDDSKLTDEGNSVNVDDSKLADMYSVNVDCSKAYDMGNSVKGDYSKPTTHSQGTFLEDFPRAVMFQSNFSGSKKPSEDIKCISEERKDEIYAIEFHKLVDVEVLNNLTIATEIDKGTKDDKFLEDLIGATKLEEDLTGVTILEDDSTCATTTKLQNYSTDATKLEDNSTGLTKLENELPGATKLEGDRTGANKTEKDSKGAIKSEDDYLCAANLEDNSMSATKLDDNLTGATKSEEDLESADKMEVCHAEQWLLPIYSGVCHAMSKPELPYLG